MVDWRDRTEAEPVRKVKTKTVAVVAVTRPPVPGFRFGGRTVAFDEEIRIPLDLAQDLEKRNKCRILDGSEKSELL
jgi:hypothetical protein